MKLYRGDKIYNPNTKPGLYRNNGLRSKAFGSGTNPANIETIGLIETIRKHVKPGNDRKYYNVTDYLSFSASKDRAMFWCSDMGSLDLTSCEEYEETRYLFEMSIDDQFLINQSMGLYEYTYACNPTLKTSDTNSLLKYLLASGDINKQCPICENQERNHSMIIINSFEFLQAYSKHQKYDGAIKYAKQDDEWLVLPNDNYEGTNFRQARVPRSDFWRAEHYKVIGEKRPDMTGHL